MEKIPVILLIDSAAAKEANCYGGKVEKPSGPPPEQPTVTEERGRGESKAGVAEARKSRQQLR